MWKNYKNDAEDDGYPLERGRKAAKRRQEIRRYTTAGERIPAVAKPHKRISCIWVHGVGWVWNPDRRPINMGEER
jgi:hypothetical protein